VRDAAGQRADRVQLLRLAQLGLELLAAILRLATLAELRLEPAVTPATVARRTTS